MFRLVNRFRRSLTVAVVIGFMGATLTSCDSSTTFGAASAYLPVKTPFYITFSQFDKDQQTRAVDLYNSYKPDNERVKNFDELKAAYFIDEAGDFKTKPAFSEVSSWLGDEFTLASIANPNYVAPKDDSSEDDLNLNDAGSVDNSKGTVGTAKTVDVILFSVKNTKLAQAFIKKHLDANGVSKVDYTGNIQRLVDNQYVVLSGYAQCDESYDFSGDTSDQKTCEYDDAKTSIQKVFDVFTSAKKGKSLSEDSAFKDNMKKSASTKTGRGYLDIAGITDDAESPAVKCAFESVGAKYPAVLPMSLDFTAKQLSFDVSLAGVTKISQGPSAQLANAPTNSALAVSLQDIAGIVQKGIDCARDSDNKELSQSADGLNAVASSYLKYLNGESTFFLAGDGTDVSYGVTVGISDTTGAKTVIKQLIDQFSLQDAGAFKEVADGEYVVYKEDTTAEETCYNDDSQTDCPTLYTKTPEVLAGIVNGKLIVASSQELYDRAKSGDTSGAWTSDAAVSDALSDAKEPSALFGAVDIQRYIKLFSSDDPELKKIGAPTKSSFDFATLRIYSKDGVGHILVNGHIKNT